MPTKQKRSMASRAAILHHWSSLGHEWAVEDCCFACGTDMYPLEKCHIKAHCLGGDGEASNLHMLCGRCHSESEHFQGMNYQRWFSWRKTADFFETKNESLGALNEIYGWDAIWKLAGNEETAMALAANLPAFMSDVKNMVCEGASSDFDFHERIKEIALSYTTKPKNP